MKSFNYFNNLPSELQSKIYSENERNLIDAQLISKSSKYITQNDFLNQICSKKITETEIKHYINNYIPGHIYFFYNDEFERNISMGVMKYNLIDQDGSDDYQYYLSFDYIETIDDLISYFIQMKGVVTKNDFKYYYRDPDLLTKYFIYKNRLCDRIQPGFSKKQILNELKEKYNQYYIKDYDSLLDLYLYIKTNLLNFPVLIPKNIFIDYQVDVHKLDVLTNGKKLTYDQLMSTLIDQVDILYIKLIEEINKL